MIYVTGDTHGELERFRSREISRLRKGDTLLVCGDFGFVWDHSAAEQKALKWLGRRRFSILFVEGTHDNIPLLEQYPQEEWNGGQVRRISGNLMYAMRGSIFTLEGKKLFTLGGGESNDIDLRELGQTWWAEEMPSAEELAQARANLEAAGNAVDYIITHDASTGMRSFLDMDELRTTPLNIFLDEVERTCTFRRWFFGSYHIDKVIPPRHTAVFQQVHPLQ